MNLARKNEELWLQGMYIHEGVNVSLARFMGNKQAKYPTEPYPITNEQLKAKREREARKKYERMKAIMEMASKTMKRGEVNDNNN